jgi:hypothetical protein
MAHTSKKSVIPAAKIMHPTVKNKLSQLVMIVSAVNDLTTSKKQMIPQNNT